MLDSQYMEARADRINSACELLNQSMQLCEEEQFQQLEKKISESARMVREAVGTITEREFTERETQLVRMYLDISHRLSEMLRARRGTIKDEFLQLNNSKKIKSIYSSS